MTNTTQTEKTNMPKTTVSDAYRVMTADEWDAFIANLPELILELDDATYVDAGNATDE